MIQDQIYKELKQQYNFIKTKKYNPLCICYVAYNFIDIQDVSSVCIVIPNDKDILNGTIIEDKLIFNDKCILIKDIRSMLHNWLDLNIFYISVLFSNYMICNSLYRENVNHIRQLLEKLVKSRLLLFYKNTTLIVKVLYMNIVNHIEDYDDINYDIYKLIKIRNILKYTICRFTV